jgi:integrase
MTNTNPDAARKMLEALSAMGLSIEDLVTAGRTVSRPQMTVAEYLPKVRDAATDGKKQTYATYWRLLADQHGNVPLSDIKTSMLQTLSLYAKTHAVQRSNSRNGTSAQESCVSAMRCFFALAEADCLIERSPAAALKKPTRQPSDRRAFSDEEVVTLYNVTSTGGDDPVLDTLLLRFHLETGARRGGALALRRRDLNVARQCIRLREKNEKLRWQPVSKTLLDALFEHCDARGALTAQDAVFRHRPRQVGSAGIPITRRRYNTLVGRWGKSIPWVQELGVSIHWCRHHATSSIERIAGYGVARAFAGHSGGDEVTTTYIKANLNEVARAVAIYTGEPHPLASS